MSTSIENVDSFSCWSQDETRSRQAGQTPPPRRRAASRRSIAAQHHLLILGFVGRIMALFLRTAQRFRLTPAGDLWTHPVICPLESTAQRSATIAGLADLARALRGACEHFLLLEDAVRPPPVRAPPAHLDDRRALFAYYCLGQASHRWRDSDFPQQPGLPERRRLRRPLALSQPLLAASPSKTWWSHPATGRVCPSCSSGSQCQSASAPALPRLSFALAPPASSLPGTPAASGQSPATQSDSRHRHRGW